MDHFRFETFAQREQKKMENLSISQTIKSTIIIMEESVRYREKLKNSMRLIERL